MRLICSLIFAILIPVTCFSQNSDTTFRIKKIPDDGIILDKGWKFHAGDNHQWAMASVNDGNWISINPAMDIHYLPSVTKAGIGWFRLKIHIDSSLYNKTLALIISQVGASEIYLNGHLEYSFGRVSSVYGNEITSRLVTRPYSIKFNSEGTQTIAVRYSFNHQNHYLNYLLPNNCLQIQLKEANEGFGFYIIYTRVVTYMECTQIVLYLLLAIISLSLYYSFKKQTAYLYIGLGCLATFIQSCLHVPFNTESFTTSCIAVLLFLSYFFSVIGVLFICVGLYKLFNESKTWLFNLSILYAFLTIPAFVLWYRWSGVFALCIYIPVGAEMWRVLFLAFRKGIPGSIILLISQTAFNLLFTIFILLLIQGNLLLSFLFSAIGIIAAPIGLSIFLAYQFARTGQALQARLIEVKQLSEQAVAQEKEKQQLLAGQNEILEQQVTERTAALNQSLTSLRATQKQLIQSEKMASLGELTAGIAHEIQNPLNFVNNFSEVNTELLIEMQAEIEKGDLGEIKALSLDIYENEKKINQHGKRADSIVKGMLEHSRTHSGQKEPTDLNAMADEFMRLSYHGLRAKDKSFNSELITNFKSALPKVNVVQQDMGRVLLNLFNNAFYAVNQKNKTAGADYKPEVSVTTTLENGHVTVNVKDNGIGIPDAIKEKITQPFFTTKPPGEGTGLGLSLTYDMVVKGHGGSINVKSKEGEFTEFTVSLPLI